MVNMIMYGHYSRTPGWKVNTDVLPEPGAHQFPGAGPPLDNPPRPDFSLDSPEKLGKSSHPEQS